VLRTGEFNAWVVDFAQSINEPPGAAYVDSKAERRYVRAVRGGF
jgi:hypothetical protein